MRFSEPVGAGDHLDEFPPVGALSKIAFVACVSSESWSIPI